MSNRQADAIHTRRFSAVRVRSSQSQTQTSCVNADSSFFVIRSAAVYRELYERRKSSTKFRRSLRGASRSAASTAERAFFLPASSAGTAVPTSARKSGTRPQNTAGSSGNATANSWVVKRSLLIDNSLITLYNRYMPETKG